MYSLMVVLSLGGHRRLPARLRVPPAQVPARVLRRCSRRCSTPTAGASSSPPGTLVALAPLLLAADDRRATSRIVRSAYGAAFLLYVPWIPTLLYQTAHTGAPWLDPPRFGVVVQIAEGTARRGHREPWRCCSLPAPAIAARAGHPLQAQARARPRSTPRYPSARAHSRSPGCSRSSRRRGPRATSAWRSGPIFLLASLGPRASGLPRASSRWSSCSRSGRSPSTGRLKNKSNAADLGAAVEDTLRPGDLVITLQPEQAPLMDYTLPPGLDEATELGEVKTQGVMDWRDCAGAASRLPLPRRTSTPLLDRLPRSRRVLLVHPVTSNIGDWDAPWTSLVRRRAAQWGQAMELDRRFERENRCRGRCPHLLPPSRPNRCARRALHKNRRLRGE